MNLQPNSLVFGVAPAILIDCAQQLHRRDQSFTFERFCEALGAPTSEAKPVFDQMLVAGYMRPDESEPGMYEPLQLLAQLALANITEGISRKEAEQLLKAVLEKAEEINRNPEEFNCEVVCLVVFGSYLTKKTTLGDLDIGVELRRLAVIQRRKGQSLQDYLNACTSPTRKARTFLKLRKPNKISIHELEEVVSMKTPYQVVYGELCLKGTP